MPAVSNRLSLKFRGEAHVLQAGKSSEHHTCGWRPEVERKLTLYPAARLSMLSKVSSSSEASRLTRVAALLEACNSLRYARSPHRISLPLATKISVPLRAIVRLAPFGDLFLDLDE